MESGKTTQLDLIYIYLFGIFFNLIYYNINISNLKNDVQNKVEKGFYFKHLYYDMISYYTQ